MKILVTGGAGYIGSHTTLALLEAGHRVVVIDDLSYGRAEAVPGEAEFVRGDLADAGLVRPVLENGVDAVIHFAGSIVVPESVAEPLKYYRNNLTATIGLLEACDAVGVGRLIFSSSAAVYGTPESVPISEDAPLAPINPYGRTKRMAEQIIEDLCAARPVFSAVMLRYFNVAGADPAGRAGQSTPMATHLIKVAAQAALGRRDGLDIYGDDYPTPDGTCIRDYIHVTDLADIHVRALDLLAPGSGARAFNCGYGRGVSVRQVADAVRRASGVDFPVRLAPRREGDPAELVADPSRINAALGWTPRHDDLDEIVRSALAWERTLPGEPGA